MSLKQIRRGRHLARAQASTSPKPRFALDPNAIYVTCPLETPTTGALDTSDIFRDPENTPQSYVSCTYDNELCIYDTVTGDLIDALNHPTCPLRSSVPLPSFCNGLCPPFRKLILRLTRDDLQFIGSSWPTIHRSMLHCLRRQWHLRYRSFHL